MRTSDSGMATKSKMLREAFAAFDCAEEMHDAQRQALESAEFYEINNPDDFVTRTGLVYAMGDAGSLHKARFWTASGPEVYEEFVQFLIRIRGTGVTVEGETHQKRISVSPQESEVASDKKTVSVKTRHADVYIDYRDGVIFLSESPEVFRFTVSEKFKSVMSLGAGKDWFLWADPTEVPQELRLSLLRTIEHHAGFALQQRNGELKSAYAGRRLIADVYFRSIRSLFLEVTEVTSWLSYPSEGQPFKFHLRVNTSETSATGKLLQEFPSSSKLDWLNDETRIANIRLCFRIPEELKPLCSALVSEIPLENNFLKALLNSHITEGQFDVLGMVGADDTDRLVLNGVSRSGSGISFVDRVPDSAREVDGEYTQIPMPAVQAFLPLTEPHFLWLRQTRELIEVSLRAANGDPSFPFGQLKQAGLNRIPAVDIEFDLSKVREFNDSDAVHQVFTELERACHLQTALASFPEPIRNRYHNQMAKQFRPLLNKVRSGGDWKCTLRTTIDASGIAMSVSAGLDAFQFAACRKYLGEAAFLNAVSP